MADPASDRTTGLTAGPATGSTSGLTSGSTSGLTAGPATGPATGWAGRIGAATPPGRDRGVDALRALAIGGVVLGHWLVTAWTPGPGGRLAISSPLAHLPAFTPLSWVLQTLAVFFFVGGYAAARSLRSAPGVRVWLRARAARLLPPVMPLLLVWTGIAAGLALHGTPWTTIRALALPALAPLWFLAVFAALTAATPLLTRLRPAVTTAAAVAVVLAVDTARFWPGGPAWLDRLGWVNLAAGWLVPYALGAGWAGGGFASRRTAAALLAGGTAGAVVLVAGFGYPASMVGVTGAQVSNLSPPTLAAVCFGLAQVGLALLVRGPLARLMRRPRLWAVIALVNLSAMTLFLWHQTALSMTAVAALRFGDVPGLLSSPSDPSWLAHRLAWLAAIAALFALAGAAGTVLRTVPPGPRATFHDKVSSSS
ncbi:acyltransferase [Planomonospora sp. ID82291]|uniref:acyltransferase family protein n=1 Tax=Planomonospora sp. ID82291 TaxID=2738136 RepID=UPI001A194087|nr:acyltransferase [Planomonospora sp. ID82291]MBG0817635.1 acyltransferase [Planomonospora sp. ID82291]